MPDCLWTIGYNVPEAGARGKMMGAKWRGEESDKGDDKGRGKGRGMEACPGPRSRGSAPRFLFFRLSPAPGQGSMNIKMSDERFCLASCEHCGQHIEFPAHGCRDEGGVSALREGDCPRRGGPASQGKPDEITAGELKAALAGPCRDAGFRSFTRAACCWLLASWSCCPWLILAFAILTGYCVYWYAVNAQEMFSSLSGSVYLLILKSLSTLDRSLGGAVAVFFMFKPILARSPNARNPSN